VTNEHGVPTPVVQSPPHRRRIVVKTGQGEIDGDNVMAAPNEVRPGPTPAPRPVRDAVNQHQRPHRASSLAVAATNDTVTIPALRCVHGSGAD
jgi:hypothetical protein